MRTHCLQGTVTIYNYTQQIGIKHKYSLNWPSWTSTSSTIVTMLSALKFIHLSDVHTQKTPYNYCCCTCSMVVIIIYINNYYSSIFIESQKLWLLLLIVTMTTKCVYITYLHLYYSKIYKTTLSALEHFLDQHSWGETSQDNNHRQWQCHLETPCYILYSSRYLGLFWSRALE